MLQREALKLRLLDRVQTQLGAFVLLVAEEVERLALGRVSYEEEPARQVELGKGVVEGRMRDVLLYRVGRLKTVLRDQGRRERGVCGRRSVGFAVRVE